MSYVAWFLLFASTSFAADPEWIAVLDPDLDRAEEVRNARVAGASVRHAFARSLNGFSFTGDDAAVAAVAARRGVRAVVPNATFSLDESASMGWLRIDADVAHADPVLGDYRGAGARVLILDSGADLDHPDLVGNLDLAASLDCLTPGSLAPPEDLLGHGTHVAGIAAATYNADGFGAVGVAADADLVIVRAFDATGYGTTDDILCGLEHAFDLAADGLPMVVNMSFGDSGTDTACDDGDVTDVLHEAICDGVDAGILFVAGSGNDYAAAGTTIPAAYRDEVVTVSALADFDGAPGGLAGCGLTLDFLFECDDTLADFSNGGAAVDVVAPGVQIWSTLPGGGHGTMSGTSMAAPFVTGVVASMLSADPTLTVAEVEAILKSTGECPNGTINADGAHCLGQGAWGSDRDKQAEPLVNAARAVQAALDGADDPAPAITLAASPYKVRGGAKRVDLTWTVTTGTTADVWRDGVIATVTADDGAWTDATLPKGPAAAHTYQVCTTAGCSNAVDLVL